MVKRLWLPALLVGGLGLFLALGGRQILSWQTIALHYGTLTTATETNLVFAATTFLGIYIIAVAFSLPVAAVPYHDETTPAPRPAQPQPACGPALETAGIDVDWVLGLLGVGGGASGPVADYLPLLREAAELFQWRANRQAIQEPVRFPLNRFGST